MAKGIPYLPSYFILCLSLSYTNLCLLIDRGFRRYLWYHRYFWGYNTVSMGCRRYLEYPLCHTIGTFVTVGAGSYDTAESSNMYSVEMFCPQRYLWYPIWLGRLKSNGEYLLFKHLFSRKKVHLCDVYQPLHPWGIFLAVWY